MDNTINKPAGQHVIEYLVICFIEILCLYIVFTTSLASAKEKMQ